MEEFYYQTSPASSNDVIVVEILGNLMVSEQNTAPGISTKFQVVIPKLDFMDFCNLMQMLCAVVKQTFKILARTMLARDPSRALLLTAGTAAPARPASSGIGLGLQPRALTQHCLLEQGGRVNHVYYVPPPSWERVC